MAFSGDDVPEATREEKTNVRDDVREAATSPAPETATSEKRDIKMELGRVSGKRKEHPPLSSHPTGRFKAVSHLIVAMQRFQGALNPTYRYGKRTASFSSDGRRSPEVPESPEVTSAAAGAGPHAHSGAGTPPPVKVFQNRGHRTSLLFAPIPPVQHHATATGP